MKKTRLSTHTLFVAADYLTSWTYHFKDRAGTCFLDSCNHISEKNPAAFLFLNPLQTWSESFPTLNVPAENDCVFAATPSCCSPFETLIQKIALTNGSSSSDNNTTAPSFSSLPIYGSLSYEMGLSFKDIFTVVQHTIGDPAVHIPLYALFQATIWAIYSYSEKKVTIWYAHEAEYLSSILAFFENDSALFSLFLQGKNAPSYNSYKSYNSRTAAATLLPSDSIIQWQTQSEYCSKVDAIRELIRQGDIYQLNVSYEIQAIANSVCAFSIFSHLVKNNPSPQSAYLVLTPTLFVVSSSPERLIKRSSNIIQSQPIKGTRPRGTTQKEDSSLFLELATSQKERSELAMITDLIRNDLFHLCLPKTIEVISAYHIDAYESVFQQSSRIQGMARSHLTALQALQYLFPGGSITGCPKIRAMQRIWEIEQRKRGIYTGSIGYILDDEQYDWNIAIRTIIVEKEQKKLSFAVGSGITWQSQGEEEYAETLHKAKSLLRACRLL